MQNKEYRHFIVAGALLEKDGKYLLIKESAGPDKGKWNIPAGKWDVGESIIECVEREVKEESGFDFKATNILGLYSAHKEKIEVSVIAVIFIGVIGENFDGTQEDVEETKWFTKKDIMDMNADTLRLVSAKEFIEDYEKGIRYPLDLIKED